MVEKTEQINPENVIKRKRGRPPKRVQPAPVETTVPETESSDVDLSITEPVETKKTYPANLQEPVSDLLPLTLGMMLQQARIQQHLKLSSIAKKLCIKEAYLEALEQGHYYVFPALVYGAGFLRSYATFLGLDADKMAARFQHETTNIKDEDVDVPHTTDPRIIPNWRIIIKSAIALFLLYLAWNIFQALTEKTVDEVVPPAIEINIVTPDQVEAEAPLTTDEVVVSDVQKKEQTAPESAPAPEPVPPKPVEKQKAGTSYGLPKPARVSFLATDTVKIEIRDTETDSVIFQQTLNAGDRYNPIEQAEGLVLGTTNAGGLDVYIDGKKVRTLGKKGQTKSGVAMDAKSLKKE